MHGKPSWPTEYKCFVRLTARFCHNPMNAEQILYLCYKSRDKQGDWEQPTRIESKQDCAQYLNTCLATTFHGSYRSVEGCCQTGINNTYCCILTLSASVVLSGVGCLWIIRMELWKESVLKFTNPIGSALCQKQAVNQFIPTFFEVKTCGKIKI